MPHLQASTVNAAGTTVTTLVLNGYSVTLGAEDGGVFPVILTKL